VAVVEVKMTLEKALSILAFKKKYQGL